MSLQTELRWRHLDARALASDAGLRGQWDRLNAQALDLPFMAADSIAAALREFGSSREQLCVGSRGGDTVAMAVTHAVDALRWTLFQPSQLPLGAWVATSGTAIETLAASLLHGGLPPWAASLSFTQVDPLQAARGEERPDGRFNDYIQTAWLEIEGSFEGYWAARGKNLRQNSRKQRNKLADEGVVATMQIWREPGDMAAAVGRYGLLESTGWKAGTGTAVHKDNAQGRYYTRLLEDAARRGEALVTEYLFGDSTAAMNLGLLRGGTWTVLKTAYDENLPKALSPSSLLREDELKCFFDSAEVRRIEYYGRVMEWHTRLTANQRTLYHYTAYRWPWLKRLAERRRQSEAPTPALPQTQGDAP